MDKQKIRTRIAPSPTGYLHLGTARTALFNFLFAKKNDGEFVLRIEDTDPVRSKKEYENDIIDGLKWLNLNWDNKTIYRQSERKDLYQTFAQKLISAGAAYEKDGAIWFKLDSFNQNTISYTDLILGKLQFAKENFNDFVLIKRDGTPLYQFACVVDDSQMNITHIIRGADHINSTPQQIMIYNILKITPPQFGHIPLILNQDRSKMSKRKNPVSISADFKLKGYLSEALVNYLSLLGWSPKNDQEFFTMPELIKEFDLTKINKSGAIFDLAKLNYFNNYYIQKLSDEEIYKLVISYQLSVISLNKDKILRIIKVIKPRMQTLAQFTDLSHFFFNSPDYNKKLLIFKKSTKESTIKGLAEAAMKLNNHKINWDSVDDLNKILLDVIKENKLSNGDVFWPIRVALSGMEKSPSPVELLWAMGKSESLNRINLAINKLK